MFNNEPDISARYLECSNQTGTIFSGACSRARRQSISKHRVGKVNDGRHSGCLRDKKRPAVQNWGFPGGSMVKKNKKSACKCKRCRRYRFSLWVEKIPWRRAWQPTPVYLPGESQGQRSLVGYSL